MTTQHSYVIDCYLLAKLLHPPSTVCFLSEWWKHIQRTSKHLVFSEFVSLEAKMWTRKYGLLLEMLFHFEFWGEKKSVIIRSNISFFLYSAVSSYNIWWYIEKTLNITELTVTRSSILQFIIGFITVSMVIRTTRCNGNQCL